MLTRLQEKGHVDTFPCPHNPNLCIEQVSQDAEVPSPCPGHELRDKLLAAVQSLDSTYQTAHADLLAEWPTAIESPVLQDELTKLNGTVFSLVTTAEQLTHDECLWGDGAVHCVQTA